MFGNRRAKGPFPAWPLFLIAAPAAVAVWSGWVGLGTLAGFGIVHPLPGIADRLRLNTAITLPVGVEAYGSYALAAWLTGALRGRARVFAMWSAAGSLALGMAGQVIYHLLAAMHARRAPWPVVVLVACLPVVTLGCGVALAHLIRRGQHAAPDMAADTEPDTQSNTPADSTPDTGPDIRPDTNADTGPDKKRTLRRTSAAAGVARLRARHPDMPVAEIAKRLGISDRTVRRHLARAAEPDSTRIAA